MTLDPNQTDETGVPGSLPAPGPSITPGTGPAQEPEQLDLLDGYAVKLPAFEGPLDLLLHLIRQNEVDITDIPVARIAQQYLETIELMQELNLDVAAEYLVMAATLALIKSRMLLPDESHDEEEIGDPRAELVQRLLEYQRFKEAAETLSRRRLLNRDVWNVRGPGPEPTPDSAREIEVGLFDLVAAFKQVLDAASSSELKHEIESEHVTVRDRMMVVMDLLESEDNVEFMRVFERGEGGGIPTRPVLVATFLAILELARLTALRLYQGLDESGSPEGPIRLRRAELAAEEPSWRERITETM